MMILTSMILQDLSLIRVKYPSGGEVPFAEAIKANKSLVNLSLVRLALGVGGMHALASALKEHSSLESLMLINLGMRDAGAGSMAQMLSGNKMLQDLGLSDTTVTEQGMQLVAEALTHSDVKKTDLDVRRCYADMMRSNRSITVLLLHTSSWSFRPGFQPGSGVLGVTTDEEAKGFKLIVEALECNTTLRILVRRRARASHCDIETTALVELLRVNRSIVTLELQPPPSESGILEILQVLYEIPRPCGFGLLVRTHEQDRLQKKNMGTAAVKLGLPAEAADWCDDDILTYIQHLHVDKLLVFQLGLHPRAGSASSVQVLAGMVDCVSMVTSAYWGI